MADILPASPEQAALRRAVRQIADKYGHRYFVECATSHKEPTELYGELGAGGFLGVHLRLLTARAAELADAGDSTGEAVNMAKFAAAEASLKTLDQAIQVHGGNGLSREYGLADLWFLARMLRTAPTSREMVLNFVAQHSLRLPESY
jgi:alkylation response protein AidB-like acyl-CoA dehydrogenase